MGVRRFRTNPFVEFRIRRSRHRVAAAYFSGCPLIRTIHMRKYIYTDIKLFPYYSPQTESHVNAIYLVHNRIKRYGSVRCVLQNLHGMHVHTTHDTRSHIHVRYVNFSNRD